MSVNPGDFGFYLAKQAGKGTAATMATTAMFLERIDGDVMVDKEWAKLQTSGSSGWGGGRAYLAGVKLTSDTLTVMCSPKMAGAVMAWCLGADTITGVADPYSHAIIPASTSPWLTLWRMVDNEWTQMKDCKIVDWAFDAANDGDAIVARFTLKFIVCALPLHLDAAPSSLAVKETAFYTFWMGAASWLADMGAGVETNQAGISKVHIAAARPTSTPKGESFVPLDAFQGTGGIEVGFDVLATDHVAEFIHLFGAANPADLAPMNTALVIGSVTFILTAVGAAPGPESSIKFDINRIEYRPEGVAITPDAAGTETYYRMVGDAEGNAPLMTTTVKNAHATGYLA